MKYTMYRIRKRKYSSNIIEGGYYENDKIVWRPLLAPILSKKKGDELCEKLLLFLSEIEQHSDILMEALQHHETFYEDNLGTEFELRDSESKLKEINKAINFIRKL